MTSGRVSRGIVFQEIRPEAGFETRRFRQRKIGEAMIPENDSGAIISDNTRRSSAGYRCSAGISLYSAHNGTIDGPLLLLLLKEVQPFIDTRNSIVQAHHPYIHHQHTTW